MLNERLKELRKSFKLTQVEMAKKLNISQPAYGDWERGKFEPSPEKLKILANFFNVSTDYLLGNTDQKNAFDIDEEALEASLRKSIGYNGQPPTEQEVENMKNALIDYLKNR
ncbi:helix-turn-helix domain-containing protein [Streptococcus pluranimalium]|uniref:helix-turn-helix domain-containing protein n=1 Tax=Streptococcus pluranimalium TaxID=82348 RepID=UPI003F67B09E